MENKTLLNIDGYIGRRNFIINYLTVCLILVVFKSILSYIEDLIVLFFPSYIPMLYDPTCNLIMVVVLALMNVILLTPTIKKRVIDTFVLHFVSFQKGGTNHNDFLLPP